MKKIFASFGWILLILPLISVAGTKTILHSFRSSALYTDERQVSDFTGVSSSGSYAVYIKMGSAENLRIEGDEDDVKNIETKVENGILKIRNKSNSGGWGFNISNKVKIYITAKAIQNLSISGSGSMEVSGLIKSDKLNTQVSGSGSISLNTSTPYFNGAVSGSGKINVSGTSQKANISISGSGEFRGRDLKIETANIQVSGSGEAYAYVDQTLNASLSGSGEIHYSGNAKVNQNKSGSGRISKD